MCNIAGYIGPERAAPILLKMLEAQEGFGGGYYSGIATIAEGELHHAKVIGDVARLCKDTDAENFPGNVGIIHSRSNSKGDQRWAHPFIDCTGCLALVGNGIEGFPEYKEKRIAVAEKLINAGHTIRARDPEPVGEYPVLADGSCVHYTEIMCHQIEACIAELMSPAEAIRKTFVDVPIEAVGLMIHTDTPNCIYASRFNFPLMVGHGSQATYLSTTALVFPKDAVNWIFEMPSSSTLSFYRDRMEILPFDPSPAKVADIMPWKESIDKILELLATREGVTIDQMKVIGEFWPKGVLAQRNQVIYEVLRRLYDEGRIRFETGRVEGAVAGRMAPKTKVFLTG